MGCAHVWINRTDPLRRRRVEYRAVIGPGRDEMKLGEVYHCRVCGVALPVGAAALLRLPIAEDLLAEPGA